MKKILIMDMGTYCDNNMMDLITSNLHVQHEIIYITTTGRIVPPYVKSTYTFDMPSFIKNAEIDFDIMDNVTLWGLKNPLKAYKLYDWITTMKNLIEKAVIKHNPDKILLHYSVTMLLWRLNLNIPIYIIYYAPGLINKTIPWIFDPVLKSPDYTNSKELIESTWESYYKKMSGLSIKEKPTEIFDKLRQAHHIFCWDPAVMPQYMPYTGYIGYSQYASDFKVSQVGFIYSQSHNHYNSTAFLHLHLHTKHTKHAFLSFGSYSSSPELLKILPIIFDSLKKAKYFIIFHSTQDKAPEWIKYITNVYTHIGFLPYDWIVPQCDLVMFTGSVCMQTVCLYNKVSMIYVPLLAEQFFWARNYNAFTGVPFCNYLKKNMEIKRDLTMALTMDKSREKRYLTKVAKSMRARNGVDGIVKILNK